MQRRSGARSLGAVLFTDIVGSTPIAAEMGNTRWGELVARHHRILRRLISKFGGHEVDTAGDGFFVTFERPADAIRCAVEATAAVRELGIEIRAGVSFGELETAGRKAGGLVVNTAARVMSVAGPGEVLVPASVREIVPGSGITFAEHGVHQLKGLEGEFRLFGVTGLDGNEVAPPAEVEDAAERRREIFPTGRRRTPLLIGAAVGALAVIVGIAVLLLSGGSAGSRKERSGPLHDAVARIDMATGRVVATVPLERRANQAAGFLIIGHPMAVGEGGVWVLRPPFLLHIDPLHEEVRSDINIGAFVPSRAVATGFDAVWVLGGKTVYRMNPATHESEVALDLPVESSITTYSLALGDAIFVGISDGTLVRLDPATGGRKQVDTGSSIDGIAATRDGVWLVDVLSETVVRVDAASLRRIGRPIQVGGSLDQIAASGDSVWILDRHLGQVTQIDAKSNHVEESTRVGERPTDMALGAGAVWVGDNGGSVYRVDAETLQVTEIPVGAEVLGVGVDAASGSLWVYVGKAVPSPAG